MKWSGLIGYSTVTETEPGIWTESIVEKKTSGDLLTNMGRYSADSNTPNDSFTVSNKISIVSNSFVKENLGSMKYLTFMGSKWKISTAEIKYPRILITLGGVYNE